MIHSRKNIDFLNKKTAMYHTRAERSSYFAHVVNIHFVNNATVAQAIFEFITGDQMNTSLTSEVATKAASYALNCQDSDNIVDMRKF